MSPASLSRPLTATLAMLLVGGILALDLAVAGAPDLFTAPSAIALGSGAAPEGAHCSGN